MIMNKRQKKKQLRLERNRYTKLLARDINHFRHSEVGLKLHNGTIIGYKDCFAIPAIEYMYVKYRMDPYGLNRLIRALKNAVFDIEMDIGSYVDYDNIVRYGRLYFENKKLYLWTVGSAIKSRLGILLDNDKTKDPINEFYIYEYIKEEVKMIPKNKAAEQAIACLDRYIVCWACNLSFYDYNHITDEDVVRIKTYLNEKFIEIDNQRENE